ncbi:RlmE family RNA methyltransferase [Robbsia andropogonis]|uniref:RlmE family RNA methyltransferase n=1 Tax=Robbsia andropogonis TaxID=28092 RepID=UPI0004632E34|nr:RlmE family RNA methyltransferase [Robbsia andropogonis]
MAKNRFSHAWLHDHINDPYVKMAQRDGYRARAAYKLKEIDEQDKLIRPGMVIVDLGAAPGSWSQYARNRLGMLSRKKSDVGTQQDGHAVATDAASMRKAAERAQPASPALSPDQPSTALNGRIIALDMLPMAPIADVAFLQGDFREDDVLEKLEKMLGGCKVDLVISDMAPNLSGVALADAARIEHVCDLALEFSQRHLTPDGALLVKCFHGSGYSQIIEKFKHQFRVVAPRKPKASRDKSSETFILGKKLKHPG